MVQPWSLYDSGRRFRQPDHDVGALSLFAFDLNLTAVCSDDFLDDGQPQPCMTALGISLGLVKALEDLLLDVVRHRETGVFSNRYV